MEVIEAGLGVAERTHPWPLAPPRALGGEMACPRPMAIIRCHTWEALLMPGDLICQIQLLDAAHTCSLSVLGLKGLIEVDSVSGWISREPSYWSLA